MIPTIYFDDKLFCNGGEQLLYKSWTLYSNFSDEVQNLVSLCLKKSGLCCYISKEAYDRYGHLLPNTFSIYIPENFLQEEASLRFIQYFNQLASDRYYKNTLS